MIIMTIRDRGKMKWQGFFMPEHVKLLKDMYKDHNYQQKPIIDEYQWEEFDSRIHLAMEFAYNMNFTVWEAGEFKGYNGKILRLDEINKVIYLEQQGGYFEKIYFVDVVGAEVEE